MYRNTAIVSMTSFEPSKEFIQNVCIALKADGETLTAMKKSSSLMLPTINGSYRVKANNVLVKHVKALFSKDGVFTTIPKLSHLIKIVEAIDKYFLHALSGPTATTTTLVRSWSTQNGKILKRMLSLSKRNVNSGAATKKKQTKRKAVNISDAEEIKRVCPITDKVV